MSEIIAFRWRVPEPGFEWIEADSDEGVGNAYLVVQADPLAPIRHRSYSPFEETGLFRIFGDIPPTQEGVLEFARLYGPLGSENSRRRRAPSVVVNRPKGKSFCQVAGETLESWAIEHHAMRETIALWDAIKTKPEGSYGKQRSAVEYLSSVIQWSAGVAVSYTRPIPDAKRFIELYKTWPRNKADKLALFNSRFQIVSQTDSELFEKFTPGDLVLPAQYALQRIVNEKLRQHTSRAELLWDWTRVSPDLRIQLVPCSLIGALWLQLATAIDGDRDYRRCEACKRWFEVSAKVRGDAKFCKQSCRFRAYRQRQQRARELSAQGITAQEIARLIDSDLKIVKGWLKKWALRKNPTGPAF